MLSPVGYDAAPTPPPQPSPSAFANSRSPGYGYNRNPQQQGFFRSDSHPSSAPVSRQQINLSRQDQDMMSPKSPASNPKSPLNHARSPLANAKSPSPAGGGRMGNGPAAGSFSATGPLHVDIHSKAKPYANGQTRTAGRVADDDLALTR